MDTTTKYLGFTLPHPFIAGASPLGDSLDAARRLDAGIAAIVLRSLFEEQINAEAMATNRAVESHANSSPEAATYFADPADFVIGPGEYFDIRQMKKAVKVPVIASLNGSTDGGWLEYAKSIEQAGADALELNVYQVPTDPAEAGADLERRIEQMVQAVKRSIKLPVAVKLSPLFTALPNFAKRLEDAGADAFVLFNRFFESDIDIEELAVVFQMHLSDSSATVLLRLRWLAILSGRLKKASLAVTGGVHTPFDAIKSVMCGASAIQMVSSILTRGPAQIREILAGMTANNTQLCNQ